MTEVRTVDPQASVIGTTASVAGRRRKVASIREVSRREARLLGAVGLVAVLLLWELSARLEWINPLITSSPTGVVEAAVELWQNGTLGPAMLSSAKLFAIGFGVSLVGGMIIGALIGWYKRANAVVDPWISILYAAPRIAFLPLIAVWFGPGLLGQVVVVVMIAIFPIIINVASGVAAIDRSHLRMARSFLATNRDVLLTVALPGAIPAVASGVRQGLMTGLLGVVVAEYFLGNTGIGGMIFMAGLTLRTGQAMLGALIFAVAALLFSAGLKAIENRLDRWRV